MDLFDLLTMLGGLSLFLFGMNVMGQARGDLSVHESVRAVRSDRERFMERYERYREKYALPAG